MSYEGLKVGAIIPGEFRRLAIHAGVLGAYWNLGLPRFTKIAALSTGAIVSASVASWSDHAFERLREIVLDLKASDIFSIPWETKVAALLSAGALALPFLNLFERRDKSSRSKMILHSTESVIGLGVTGYLVNSLMYSRAVFSNRPLRKLLRRTLHFESVMRSPIEIAVMTTDFQTGEHVPFSTKTDIGSLEELVTVLIASASVPVYFPVCAHAGRMLTDAEVCSDFPIEQLEDMDVVLDFSYQGGNVSGADDTSWGGHFHGMWDIAKARISEYSRREYERRRRENPRLPEVVTLQTQRRIPPLLMESFRRSELQRTVDLGKEIMLENEELVRQGLNRAL